MSRTIDWLYRTLDQHRRIAVPVLFGAVSTLSFAAAFLLRFELVWPADYTRSFLLALPALLLLRTVADHAFRLSRGRWRFVSTRDVLRLVVSTSAASAVFMALTWSLHHVAYVPRSVVLLDWTLRIQLIAGLWMAYRLLFERRRRAMWSERYQPKRVLVVGAGEAGDLLVREMWRFPTGYVPVGFIDDDPGRWGMTIQGVEVKGGTENLRAIAARAGAEEIIVAVPSATTQQLRHLVERCMATDLPFKLLPGIREVFAGKVRLDQLREIRIEDLLGRDPIKLDLPELAHDLCGRVVLITGAAGSIGSELARQVALHAPAKLVLLDQAETSLFYTEMDLRNRHPELALVPVIADVVDAAAMERVFAAHAPDRVFHAAAYKHVPLMEQNPGEAIRNNAFGTLCVAEASGRHGVGRFILVSTDKAVRPTSIMGATKRVAELIVMEAQARHPRTMFTAVRFGNVLGSAGSVIPTFYRQLQAGQPLTVTHPDVTRYFMTIPEAVQLIVQASLLSDVKGHIAMLEMGEPVRIVDLAENLLRLSGRTNGDRPAIVYTGLRPGEKLHEELVAPDEETIPTAIPKVRLVSQTGGHLGNVSIRVAAWEKSLSAGMEQAVLAELCALFPDLTPVVEVSLAQPRVALSAHS
jgi:FlaA1/EpsC-like NDP-sugar epimerase